MKTERQGKSFGSKCWDEGLSVVETLDKAAKECGLGILPKDPTKWPKFIHGAEDAWQDKNLAYLNDLQSLEEIKNKHTKNTH